MTRILIAFICALALAGCASHPNDIMPTPVSAHYYTGMGLPQLGL